MYSTTKIYVVNLAKHNNDGLRHTTGEWIELPMDADDLQDKLAKILGDDEELAIHGSESIFTINEGDNIERLNEIAEIISDSKEEENVIEAILGNWTNIDDGLNCLESQSYRVYHNCKDMEDVAMIFAEETGMLDGISETLTRYFDYAAYGSDMESAGTFLTADSNTMIEIID